MRPSRQLVGLDLIRFSAAAMVVAFHLFAGTALAPNTRWGWVGVEVFFVLSGFVIAYSAAASSAGRFLRNRAVRLMPAVWLCGSATAAMWLVRGGEPELGRRYLDTLVLWPTGPWVDPVYWTLPVEIVFYGLIFALLWAGAFRHIEAVAGALAVVSTGYLCLRIAGQMMHITVPGAPDPLGRLLLLDYGNYFALGVVLWLTFFDRPTGSRTAISAVAALGGAIQIIFACRAFSATEPILEPEAIWLVAVAAIGISAWQHERLSALAGPLTPLLRVIGLATYPLYLLHDDLFGAVSGALRDSFGHRTLMAMVAAGAAIVAALAFAKWIEPPVQGWLRSVLPGDPRRAIVDNRTLGRPAPCDGRVEGAARSVGDEAAVAGDG